MEEREWSDLPPDLLQLVVKKVASVVEFVRVRAVCRSWRSNISPAELPPQLPWLLLPYDPNSDNLPFLCLSTRIIRVLNLPNTRKKRICGSGHGWLILHDDKTTAVALINPLTSSTISLPPSGVPGWRLASAVISANPTSPSGCIVAISTIRSPTLSFSFLQPGCSSRWRKLDMSYKSFVSSIAYHQGKLCVIDSHNSLMIWDTTPQRHLSQADFSVKLPSLGVHWDMEHCQLVDSRREILLVALCLFYGYTGRSDRRYCSEVYRLDNGSQQLKRMVFGNIGDGVRFLHDNPMAPVSNGAYVTCGECLYFARYRENHGERNVNLLLKVLDLKNGGMGEVQYEGDYLPGFVSEAAWLVPSLIL